MKYFIFFAAFVFLSSCTEILPSNENGFSTEKVRLEQQKEVVRVSEEPSQKEQIIPEEATLLSEENPLPERETLVENTAKEALLEKEELHGMPFPPKCEPNVPDSNGFCVRRQK